MLFVRYASLAFAARLAAEHIVPSLLCCAAATLVAVCLISFGFIRSPATRCALWHVPLLKSLAVLYHGLPLTAAAARNGALALLPALPMDLFALKGGDGAVWQHRPEAFTFTAIAGLLLIAGMLVRRWLSLLSVYKAVMEAEELRPFSHPELFTILAEACFALEIRMPRVVISHDELPVPFTLGFRRPTIVFSPTLLETASRDELLAMLGHEAAHVRRRDYLGNWLMLILTDVLFFNPLAGWLRERICEERERACDALCIEALGCRRALHAAVSRVGGCGVGPPDKATEQRLDAILKSSDCGRPGPAVGAFILFSCAVHLSVLVGGGAWRILI